MAASSKAAPRGMPCAAVTDDTSTAAAETKHTLTVALHRRMHDQHVDVDLEHPPYARQVANQQTIARDTQHLTRAERIVLHQVTALRLFYLGRGLLFREARSGGRVYLCRPTRATRRSGRGRHWSRRPFSRGRGHGEHQLCICAETA